MCEISVNGRYSEHVFSFCKKMNHTQIERNEGLTAGEVSLRATERSVSGRWRKCGPDLYLDKYTFAG